MEGGVGGDKFSILIEQSAALSQERVEVFNRLEASAVVLAIHPAPPQRCCLPQALGGVASTVVKQEEKQQDEGQGEADGKDDALPRSAQNDFAAARLFGGVGRGSGQSLSHLSAALQYLCHRSGPVAAGLARHA